MSRGNSSSRHRSSAGDGNGAVFDAMVMAGERTDTNERID